MMELTINQIMVSVREASTNENHIRTLISQIVSVQEEQKQKNGYAYGGASISRAMFGDLTMRRWTSSISADAWENPREIAFGHELGLWSDSHTLQSSVTGLMALARRAVPLYEMFAALGIDPRQSEANIIEALKLKAGWYGSYSIHYGNSFPGREFWLTVYRSGKPFIEIQSGDFYWAALSNSPHVAAIHTAKQEMAAWRSLPETKAAASYIWCPTAEEDAAEKRYRATEKLFERRISDAKNAERNAAYA